MVTPVRREINRFIRQGMNVGNQCIPNKMADLHDEESFLVMTSFPPSKQVSDRTINDFSLFRVNANLCQINQMQKGN